LDKAIQYASNNLQALKYRISHNYQYAYFAKMNLNISDNYF